MLVGQYSRGVELKLDQDAVEDGSDSNLWNCVLTEASVRKEFSSSVQVLAANDPHQWNP